MGPQEPPPTPGAPHRGAAAQLTLLLLSCRGSFIDEIIKGFLISICEAEQTKRQTLKFSDAPELLIPNIPFPNQKDLSLDPSPAG